MATKMGHGMVAGGFAIRMSGMLLATTAVSLVLESAAFAQGAEPTVLDRIVIEGASYETDDSDSYTTNLISVGEKDVLSVREIPQSTTVLTRERLEDGGYTSLDTGPCARPPASSC